VLVLLVCVLVFSSLFQKKSNGLKHDVMLQYIFPNMDNLGHKSPFNQTNPKQTSTAVRTKLGKVAEFKK